MSLAKGDHLVIKRNGKIVEGEGYHEFEVMNEFPSSQPPTENDEDRRPFYKDILLRVVE